MSEEKIKHFGSEFHKKLMHDSANLNRVIKDSWVHIKELEKHNGILTDSLLKAEGELEKERHRANVLAATVCKLRDVVTHDAETKDEFIGRVREILSEDPDERLNKAACLAWTTEKPTKSGYYLWKVNKGVALHTSDIYFDTRLDGLVLVTENTSSMLSEAADRKWLGPLPE